MTEKLTAIKVVPTIDIDLVTQDMQDLSIIQRLGQNDKRKIALTEQEFDALDEALQSLDESAYVPRYLRNYLVDVLELLEDSSNSGVLTLINDLKKSTSELPYILRSTRNSIRYYLGRWKTHIINEGNKPRNKFLLQNGKLNPDFVKFYTENKYIKKCILSKASRVDDCIIEVIGTENFTKEEFFRALEEFDQKYTEYGITFRYIGNPAKIVDTGNFKYGDPYFNSFGIDVCSMFSVDKGSC